MLSNIVREKILDVMLNTIQYGKPCAMNWQSLNYESLIAAPPTFQCDK